MWVIKKALFDLTHRSENSPNYSTSLLAVSLIERLLFAKEGNFFLEFHLSQCHGFLGTDFLAAKAGDARIGVHLRKVILHGQGRYWALIDAGAATRAQFSISLRPQDRPTLERFLNTLVVKIPFAT